MSNPSDQFLREFYSRRLLLRGQFPQSSTTHSPPPNTATTTATNNVVMVISVLLCALICSLALNTIIRCALTCSRLVSSNSNTNSPITTKGINKNILKQFTTVIFTTNTSSRPSCLDTQCVICLSEFVNGDKVKLLPKCNHGFHVKCIDKWLRFHSSCPTCRQCLIETCQKIVGVDQASSSSSSQPNQERIMTIMPLEREGFVCGNMAHC